MFGPFSSYVRPYRVRLLLGVLAIGIAQAASNYIPMVVKDAIDTLQTQHMSEAMRFQDIQTDVLGVVLLALLVALCSYVMRILLGRASARIEYDIRTAYFAHLLKQPLSYYQTQHTGDLMSRA
ncbi:MAG: ABC transporter transmembrane domain-containing protein, partial [Candidatus Latescibacterota bacterium]